MRVLATHSIRQFTLHFPSRASPCATRFRTSSTRVSPLTSVSSQDNNNTDHSVVTSLQRWTNAFPKYHQKTDRHFHNHPPLPRTIPATLFMQRTRFVICHGIENRRPNINFHFPQKLPEQILRTTGSNQWCFPIKFDCVQDRYNWVFLKLI